MNLSSQYRTRTSGGVQGDVVTRPEVVGFMLQEVGYDPEKDLSHLSVMEPSCGEGAFVLEILSRLSQSAARYSFDFGEAFRRCVFASDIDDGKIRRCRDRIRAAYPDLTGVEQNITAEDYLRSEPPQVDVVVGNPPYVRYEEIPKDSLEVCREFSSFYYRSDIYVPFFEKSLSQLKPGGVHCFLCANRWMKNVYGKRLRHLIATDYSIEKIINVEEADVFGEEVLAYPAITVIRNAPSRGYVLYAAAGRIDDLKSIHYTQMHSPTGANWGGMDSRWITGLCGIEEQGFKIGIGVATGADNIFVSEELNGRVEDCLILPAINSKDLKGNQLRWGGRWLLNPFEKGGGLIDLAKYPKAKSYLEQHRERLSSRHRARLNPSRWYATIDAISPTLFSQPKLLLPDISANTYLFVDEGDYYPLHNIYYVVGHGVRQLRLLAALLMSDFVKQQMDSVSNRMNGGYVRWQSQYLRQIRLPRIADIPECQADILLDYYGAHDLQGINSLVEDILSGIKSQTEKKSRQPLVGRQTEMCFKYA